MFCHGGRHPPGGSRWAGCRRTCRSFGTGARAARARARRGPGAVAVDATLGLGGHAEALLAAHPRLRLVGLDRDPEALRLAGERLAPFADRISLHHAVYDEIAGRARRGSASTRVDGVLFDLGVSSLQLDEAERGLRLRAGRAAGHADGPDRGTTAADVVNSYSVAELTRVLREYGEERFARRIARSIVASARGGADHVVGAGWSSWSGTRSRPRPGVPAATRPSAPSRRCGSRSTASWRRWRRRCRPPSTRSRSAAGSWCCPTTRWRTGSSSGRSPTGPGTRRRPGCRCRCRGARRRCGC